MTDMVGAYPQSPALNIVAGAPRRRTAGYGVAMARIPVSIADYVGGTPVLELTRIAPPGVRLFGKLESFNPGGCVKDRIGVAMIEAAERDGLIEPGRTTIVEATSGNTGIALAFVCAAKGYDLILTLPQGMSREREGLLRLYGAEVRDHRVDGRHGRGGRRREAMAARTATSSCPISSPTPPTPRSTAARPGRRSGTRSTAGSTASSCGRRHRRHDHRRGRVAEGAQPRELDVVAVEPASSPVLSGGRPARTRSRASAPASCRRCSTAS